MNSRNSYFRQELPCCPRCGMYSGRRVAMIETNPEKYFVICEMCGFQTRPHPSQAAATREWRDAGKKKGGD